MDFVLQVLRAKIKGFAEESRYLRRLANKKSGKARYNIQLRKKQLGEITRCHLLVYAFLRNVPHHKVEAKNRETPYVSYNLECILDTHLGYFWHHKEALEKQKEAFKAWLKAPKEAACETTQSSTL